MIDEFLKGLESEEVETRLYILDKLECHAHELDKKVVINALKPLILDWDEKVRLRVAEVLKVYTGG